MERSDKSSGAFKNYLKSFLPETTKEPKDERPTSVEDSANKISNFKPVLSFHEAKVKKEESLVKKSNLGISGGFCNQTVIGNNQKPVDDLWDNDFPEDFSEDCIVVDMFSQQKLFEEAKKTSKNVFDSAEPSCSRSVKTGFEPSYSGLHSYVKDHDDHGISCGIKTERRNLNRKQLTSTSISLSDNFSLQSQSHSQKIVTAPSNRSSLPTSSSQALTTEWLRNQLDKVNKDYSCLKDAFTAKDGESSLLREKLRSAESEIQKIKQQWQIASSKEKMKFEEQIKELEKQLSNAKTQILFKSKEAESNLERYLELKSLSIKDPECTQVRTTGSSSFRKFSTRAEVFKDASTQSSHVDNNAFLMNPNKTTSEHNVEDNNSKLGCEQDIGKELEFFIHPDLFHESEAEFNFVIPPSTDYYPFNVMYKDISEMPSDDFSCEPLNLYNIWKVKRESFGEIMSEMIVISSDSDSDSDLESSPPNKEANEPLSSVLHTSKNKNSREEVHFNFLKESEQVLGVHNILCQNKSDNFVYDEKHLSDTTSLDKVKLSHPRLLFLGKSRYFTSLTDIHLPLIEMCKSSSWKKTFIDKIIKHITTMTKELYVAMCDPSIDSYYSTMHLRDNQIIECCSDHSELDLDYNVFSSKKWRQKEIYVDLRRGIALIKVLCDLDSACMEVILNSSIYKHYSELSGKSASEMKNVVKISEEKPKSCCSKNSIKKPTKSIERIFRKNKQRQFSIMKQKTPIGRLKIQPTKEFQKGSNKSESLFIKPKGETLSILNKEPTPVILQNEDCMDIDSNDELIEILDKNVTLIVVDEPISTIKEKIDWKFGLGQSEQIADTALSDDNNKKQCDISMKVSSSKVSDDVSRSFFQNICFLENQDSDLNEEMNINTKNVNEHLNKKIEESFELFGKKNVDVACSSLLEGKEKKEKDAASELSIMERTLKNQQLLWVEALNSKLIPVDKTSSTKIMVLRENACSSDAEKEFLTHALSTFNKIQVNMKSETVLEEDKGKKRKLSDDTSETSKKQALNANYSENKLVEDSSISMIVGEKVSSESIKSCFSLKKRRDVRPLRKSINIKEDAIPGTSKEQPNLDEEIELDIQKIFNKQTIEKPRRKKKTKKIDLYNCDDRFKTDKFYYFSHLAHSGGLLVLLFEIIREIGRKRYTMNFNFLFAVVINLVHTLLKNGNPGLIQRHFLFDVLLEILYCRPSPVALLQINKLLVDVIPFQSFFTSLMCHNANSYNMVIDSETAYFTRGACFMEVICSLIDYFMDDSNWEIQTYCVRWLSYMYLVEKTTIEEWYYTQKTICRRCQCIYMLTNMAVKIFERAASFYLRCCFESNLIYELSCQLLEIMQTGVKVLYVMIDFDKHFSENIGERYSMFLRFLDTVKLIHGNPEKFKEFNSNNKDLDIVRLLLIEEKVVDNMASISFTPEKSNETAQLFKIETKMSPKSFKCDKLFLPEFLDSEELSD